MLEDPGPLSGQKLRPGGQSLIHWGYGKSCFFLKSPFFLTQGHMARRVRAQYGAQAHPLPPKHTTCEIKVGSQLPLLKHLWPHEVDGGGGLFA